MIITRGRRARGATLMEFGLIVALIAIVAVGTTSAVGGSLNSIFGNGSLSGTLSSAVPNASESPAPELAVQTVCETQDETSPGFDLWGMYDPFTVETCLTMTEGAEDEWGNANHEWAVATDFAADGYSHYCESIEITVVASDGGGAYHYGTPWDAEPHSYGMFSFLWDGATVEMTCNHYIVDRSANPVATGSVNLTMTLASN